MAQNVKFIKGNTAKISGTTIVDGQLLYDTTAGLHYIDNESTRIQVGTSVDSALSTTSTNAIANNAITNSIINTTAEVSAITASNIPCGTKPVKELITNLTANGKKYQADYQDTKYGFTVDGVFYPFGSGAELLWTNSAPTSGFNAQTIALDLSEYVGVGIVARATDAIDDKYRTVSIGKIGNTKYNVLSATVGELAVIGRPFKANISGVVFLDPYYNTNVASNIRVIPLYIFGLKNMLGFEDYIN